jgi:threonylcarbamoyladenosine tRNA methylthiotransferase MtaB
VSRRVSVHTSGCKVNQYDSAALQTTLEGEGFTVIQDVRDADVIVVNTCTVTGATDGQNRKLIRRLRAASPCALLVVTGCQAAVAGDELRRMPEVDLVVGNRGKASLALRILRALEGGPASGEAAVPGASVWEAEVDRLPGRTRAILKVQDGCEAFCAYCIVPRARGPSQSRPVPSVLRGVQRMEVAGIQEVVLSGIHLGAYGRDLAPPVSLSDLLGRILEGCAIPRIRLSSIESLEAEVSLLERIGESDRICPHLHLPLQSGDDEILKRMNRPYTKAQYWDQVREAMDAIPDLTLGTDVIVGFPGETEEHFRRTMRFLERIPFTYLHVFPFSPRPGTAACDLPGQVAVPEITARAQALRRMSEARRVEAMTSYVGRTLPVLVERPAKGRSGWMEGLTHNYLKTLVAGGDERRNRVLSVHLDRLEGSHLVGHAAGSMGP